MCRKFEDCLVSRSGFRIFLLAISILVVAAIGVNVRFFVNNKPDDNNGSVLMDSHKANGDKHILLWTTLHGSWDNWWSDHLIGSTPHLETNNCPHLANYQFISDRRKANSSALIMFSYSDTDPLDIPAKVEGQQWALFLPEPTARRTGQVWNNLMSKFDMLVSYFPQSTVPMYRAKLVPVHKPANSEVSNNSEEVVQRSNYEVRFRKLFREIIDSSSSSLLGGNEVEKPAISFKVPQFGARRTRRKKRRAFQFDRRLVATVIDKCDSASNREGYIDAMKRFVNIHVYGECGAPCPGESLQECVTYLAKFYKFFLVFEPFMCQHYSSDLLWRVMQTEMVPVVFGGVNYSKLAPHGSHIDALNQSPKNLAHFIRYLDKNNDLYKNYLQWKEEYQMVQDSWLCLMVSRLHSPPTGAGLMTPPDRCTSWPGLNFGLNGKH